MKIAASLLAAVVVLSASACASGGSGPTPAPVTVTETSIAVHDPPDFDEPVVESSATSTNTVGYLAMELAWSEQDDDSKQGNCELYEMDPTGTVDLYMDFIENDATGFDASIERDDVINFFDNNC